MRHSLALLLLLTTVAFADDSPYEFGGHSKLRLVGQSYPDDSPLREIAGANALDAAGELRLNLAAKYEGWSFQADYQLVALHSEFLPFRMPNDDSRLFDLTAVISDSNEDAVVHRLDRFWVGYAGDKVVVRFGRQALSWGNGLIYSPMDLVNPFDPVAIDTEYKVGDDMLYMQYLLDSGNDVQGAAVFRRDPVSGNVESGERTIALKYHGFAGENEYDLLVAESYGDWVLGFGGARGIGGAIWRADVVVTEMNSDTTVEVVTNLSHSWTWGDRNVSGTAEYYFDGDDRHYLAGSLMIEMSPLWILTPTLLSNIDDPSSLLQLVTQYSLADNMTFLGSLNIALGDGDTEYGQAGYGVFAQLAWYF